MRERRLPFVDANIIIRLLTGDDPDKQARSRHLFKQIESGERTVTAPDTVIFECVFVLTSPRLYHLTKEEAAGLLLPLVQLSHFKLANKQTIQRAFDLYVANNLSFGDAYLVATMEQADSETLYSYDEGFDRLKGLDRQEP